MIKPIYEFVLWNNCNNKCIFCPQIQIKQFSSSIEKLHAIKLMKAFILSTNYQCNSHVLIAGGEIFDISNNIIKNDIINAFKFIIKQMNIENIDLCYINTNLLYNIHSILIPVLTLFANNNLLHKLKFTTSYDIYGRFKTSKHKKQFKSNLALIKKQFENINIIVNIILTKQMLCTIQHNNFSIVSFFKNKYDCGVNLLPYIGNDLELKPNILDIIKTLQHENNQHLNFINDYIYNLDLQQDKYVYRYIDDKLIFSSSDTSSCGHNSNFKQYSTSNRCYICDLKTIFNYN